MYALIFEGIMPFRITYIKLKIPIHGDEKQLRNELKVSWMLVLREDKPFGIPTLISGYQSGHLYSLTQLPDGTPFHEVYERRMFSPSMIIQFALEVVSLTDFGLCSAQIQ